MPKCRKKPVEVNFFEVTNSTSNVHDLKSWVESFGDSFHAHFEVADVVSGQEPTGPQPFKVKTPEGTSYDVTEADMVMRGVNGEYYPCKKDIFEKTYDIVE